MKSKIFMVNSARLTESPFNVEGVSVKADKFIEENQDKIIEVELADVKRWGIPWLVIRIYYENEEQE